MRKFGIVASVGIALVLGVPGTQAAQADTSKIQPRVSVSTSDAIQPRGPISSASDDAAARAAMRSAVAGDARALDQLLAAPSKSEGMRAVIREWVLANPDPKAAPQKSSSDSGLAPGVLQTGQYEVTCQGYNGQYLGWYGKAFLACHGYLRTYISGSQAGYYIPDLFPRGVTLSINCVKALTGTTITALGTLTSAPTGPLGWAAVGVAWSWSINDVRVSCKHG